MPACGGKAPFPMRMGGGKTGVAYRLDSLNVQRGTAYDVSESSPVYVENMAFARAIDACWKQNERLANQWDPTRMSSCIPRWEAILALPADPTLSEPARRRRIGKVLSRIGQIINRPKLEELLSAELGPVFVSVEYIDISNAIIHVPDGSYPFGTVAAGAPWTSTVAHILVLTQKPDGFTEGDFYEAVGRVNPLLDAVLPAWATFNWYRAPATGTPIVVAGGPSAAGFYLDNDHNLDNSVFA